MSTTFEIPLPTPSLNQVRKMHHHAYKRLRDRFEVICRVHTTPLNRVSPNTFKTVTIERRGVRLLDYDNLVGGCKPLVDALKRAGLIWDDSPRWCRITYNQTRVSASQVKTIVRVS